MSKSIKINLILLGIVGLILAGTFYNSFTKNVGAQSQVLVSGTYGVSVDGNGKFSGYAWGSDVIGWIDFSGVKIAPTISVNIQSELSNIGSGASTTISWTSIGASTCNVTKQAGANPSVPFSTATTSTGISSGIISTTTIFMADCFSVTNAEYATSTTVHVNPIMASIKANPQTVFANSPSTVISWDSTNADSCLITRKSGSGSTAQFSTLLSSTGVTSSMTATSTTFTINCSNSGGSSISASTTVTIEPVGNPGDCFAYDYGPWTPYICPSSGNRTRTSTKISVACPPGSQSGQDAEPFIVSQNCTPGTVLCDSFTYGDWVRCNANTGKMSRTYTSYPSGCTGGDPVDSKLCNEPEITSTCTASQVGSSQDLYINKDTTWQVTLDNLNPPTSRTWDGTNISPPLSSLSGTLDKTYTTVGTKWIKVTTRGTYSDGTAFSSFCSTSTIMEANNGTTTQMTN